MRKALRRLFDWLGDISTVQGLPEQAAAAWKWGKGVAAVLAVLYAWFGGLRWEIQIPLALFVFLAVLVSTKMALEFYAQRRLKAASSEPHIEITTLSGSPEVRLTVHNKGAAEHFRAESEIVATRNNPNKPRTGVYTLKWIRANTRKIRIQSDAKDNLIVARVRATREQAAVSLIELAGENELEFDHLLWGVAPNQELPEFDLRIRIYVGKAERLGLDRIFTLRPSHYSGSMIELAEKGSASVDARDRGSDQHPRATATFRRERNEIFLDVRNGGTSGEFWGEISVTGNIGTMARYRCVWTTPNAERRPPNTGQQERVIPKGDTGTIHVATLDGSIGLFSWVVWYFATQPGLSYPVQPQHSVAFGVEGAVDADLTVEILVISRPDMADGVMKRRLRLNGFSVIDLDSGDEIWTGSQ